MGRAPARKRSAAPCNDQNDHTNIANMPQSLVIFGAILLIGAFATPVGAFAIPDTVVAEPPEGSKVESFQDSSDVPEFLETGHCNWYTGGTCRVFDCDSSRNAKCVCDHRNNGGCRCLCTADAKGGQCAVNGACTHIGQVP